MTTGRIDYDPPNFKPSRADAKLDRAIQAVYRRYGTNLTAFFEDAQRAAREQANQPDVSAGRARLEREVIQAAKAELVVWEDSVQPGWVAASASARNKLRQATRTLMEFESQVISETSR